MNRRLAGLSAALILSACTVGPDYHRPEVAGAATFAPQTVQLPSGTYAGAVDTQWWTAFRDPELSHLVGVLGAQNLDLQQAAERVQQSRAARRVTAAQGLPQVNGTADYSRTRISPNGTPSLVTPAPGAPLEYNQFDVGAAATWELDLFGGVRRATEAARANTQAAIEARHGLALSAVADLATDYMQLREVQAQGALIRRNIVLAQQRLALVLDRYREGAASRLDIAQARAQASAIQQNQPDVLRQEAALTNAIALLLAEPPRALAAELTAPTAQPDLPPAVPVGLPGDLVRQRPDVREAEARLHAATAETGVAIADFYPAVTLTGSAGLQSLRLPTLFDWASRVFMAGPSLRVPIFQGGRLRATLDLRRSQQREAMLAFRETALQAWHDVDNALTAHTQAQALRAVALSSREADQLALAVAEDRYRQGATSFLDVVVAQQTLLGAESAVVQADAGVRTSLVTLYRALGGGWEAVPDPISRH